MRSNPDALRILTEAGAVLEKTHVVLTSGRHSNVYVNKDAMYPNTDATSSVCRMLAAYFSSGRFDVVVGPAFGGIILSQWVTHHLSQLNGRAVLSVYAEKEGDGFVLRRGYDKLVGGMRVLVVEDVLTTGGSVAKVVTAVTGCGGDVLAVGALCNRGGVTAAQVGAEVLYSLVNLDIESWAEQECPLCANGVPTNTTVGKGREFLARKEVS